MIRSVCDVLAQAGGVVSWLTIGTDYFQGGSRG